MVRLFGAFFLMLLTGCSSSGVRTEQLGDSGFNNRYFTIKPTAGLDGVGRVYDNYLYSNGSELFVRQDNRSPRVREFLNLGTGEIAEAREKMFTVSNGFRGEHVKNEKICTSTKVCWLMDEGYLVTLAPNNPDMYDILFVGKFLDREDRFKSFFLTSKGYQDYLKHLLIRRNALQKRSEETAILEDIAEELSLAELKNIAKSVDYPKLYNNKIAQKERQQQQLVVKKQRIRDKERLAAFRASGGSSDFINAYAISNSIPDLLSAMKDCKADICAKAEILFLEKAMKEKAQVVVLSVDDLQIEKLGSVSSNIGISASSTTVSKVSTRVSAALTDEYRKIGVIQEGSRYAIEVSVSINYKLKWSRLTRFGARGVERMSDEVTQTLVLSKDNDYSAESVLELQAQLVAVTSNILQGESKATYIPDSMKTTSRLISAKVIN